MGHNMQPVKIYVHRFSASCFTLSGTLFATMVILKYFVFPTPALFQTWSDHEPFRTLISVCGALLAGYILVGGLYWTFRPAPILLIDATRLVYHPYPFVKRSFRWADISGITVFNQPVRLPRLVNLTLLADIKPEATASYRYASQLRLTINLPLLPISLDKDELECFLQRYMIHQAGFQG